MGCPSNTPCGGAVVNQTAIKKQSIDIKTIYGSPVISTKGITFGKKTKSG